MKIPNYLATDGADVRTASANFTLSAQDNGRTIVVSGSRTVTIPIGLHKGFYVSLVALTGVITLSPASGVTYQGNRSIGTGASGTVIAVAGNSYVSDVPSGSGVKVYRALLTQTGTDAPVATVLENSLGLVPTYGYSDVGSYTINSTGGLFTLAKTVVSFGPLAQVDATACKFVGLIGIDPDVIVIKSGTLDAAAICVFANDILSVTHIQILVYP